MLKFFTDDFAESPRRCESSEKVVRYWLDGRSRYDIESKVEDLAFRGIVAERIVLRRMLGLDVLEREHLAYVPDAMPFGEGSPKLAEFILPDVFMAMAFVPLTPLGEMDRPVLARLYCVRGLSQRYFPDLMLQDGLLPGMESYSWFLTGLPDDKLCKAIDGRSWLLAAELLKRVVAKRDIATARNLTKHFIVTGDVRDELICRVEMGRKDELTQRRVYKDFKWIMPKENDMDNVPKRKIEKPATLDEAYKLIESMQSVATKSMFRFLRKDDLDGVKQQCQNGADIFACEESTGQMPMEILGELIEKEARQPSDNEQKLHPNGATRLMRLKEMVTWLKAQGADCALMFYMLAKYGLDEALKSCLKIWPIDARTASGLNATELALESGDYDAARKLSSLGGKCRPEIQKSFLSKAVNSYFDEQNAARTKPLVEVALSVGMSPYCQYHQEYRYKTTLFGAALHEGDFDLVEKCLEAGADPNALIKIERWYDDADESYRDGIVYWEGAGYYCGAKDKGTPLYIVNCNNDVLAYASGRGLGDGDSVADKVQEIQDEISALLMKYGAKKDVRVTQWQYRHEVIRFLADGDSECKRRVLKFIDEGQPIDIQVSVKYSSADDVPKTETLMTTLWGAAVYYGDVELMRKCLEHGASVTAKLRFAHAGEDKVVDLQYLNGCSPIEVILMSEDIPLTQQNGAFELLKEYGLRDADCSRELMATRHSDEVLRLGKIDDVNRQCQVEMGEIGVDDGEQPETGITNVLGKAVWCMWIDVLERCLFLGVSARNEIYYEDVYGGPKGETVYVAYGTPRQIINKHEKGPSWLRNRALKLLATYENR